MILTQQFEVRAPRQALWDFLMDVKKVAACMPGVEAVEPLGDDNYQVRLGVKVGPIKASLGGQVAIVQIHPPQSMRVRADWKDANTGSKTQVQANIELAEASEGVVTCRLTADVSILGVLGKYGQGIADRKAAEINRAFAECVRATLEREASSPGAGRESETLR